VQNFAFKFQAVAEKTAKNIRGLLYFAAPCMCLTSLLCSAGCNKPSDLPTKKLCHSHKIV